MLDDKDPVQESGEEWRSFNNTATITTAIILSFLGAAIFLLQPVYVGALAEELQFDNQQIGVLVGAEIGGNSVAAIAAFFLIKRLNWRVYLTLSLVVLAVGNFLSCLTTDYSTLLLIRPLTGLLGMGPVYALSIAILSATEHLSRNFGWAVFGQVLFGMLGLTFLPSFIGDWGVAAVYLLLTVLAVLSLFLVRFVPLRGKAASVQISTASLVRNRPAMLGVLSQWVWYIGIGGVWTFIERIGVGGGIEVEAVGRALGIGMGVGLLGALFAGFAGERFGRLLPPVLAMISQVLIIGLFVDVGNYFVYMVAACLFNFMWNLTLPFLFELVAVADVSGRFSVLLPTAQSTGIVVGAVMAGSLAEKFTLNSILYMGAITTLLALGLYTFVAVRVARAEPQPADN